MTGSPAPAMPPVSFLQSGDTELDLPGMACFILVDWSASLSCSISPRTILVGEPGTMQRSSAIAAQVGIHLRLRLPLRVDAVKRVEHGIGGVARPPRRGDHRVEDAEIGDPDENQGFARSAPRPIRGAALAVNVAAAAAFNKSRRLILASPKTSKPRRQFP